MSIKGVEPAKGKAAFTCPRCGAFSKFDWHQLGVVTIGGFLPIKHEAARCHHCDVLTLWAAEPVHNPTNPKPLIQGFNYRLVYPAKMTAPQAHADLPKECLADLEEARAVLDLSPRAAAALLRLVTEKLCRKICEDDEKSSSEGKDLNALIKEMVAKGLPFTIQQALDSLRIIGNESVHPGTMDMKDDNAMALRLFSLVEIVVEQRITQPKKIAEVYGKLPPAKVDGIEKRDK